MPVLSDDQLNQIAREGDALNRVNTILGRNPMPGVGAPGSTPQTDAGNISMANAMERSDRGNRFGFGSQQYAQNTDTPVVEPAADTGGIDIGLVNQRRNQILRGIDPDRPALYVDPKRKAELIRELGFLTNIVHDNVLDTARTTHDNLIKHRTIQVAQQSENIFKGLQDINPDGTPQSEQALHKLIAANRLAFDVSPAVREEVKRHAKFHDAAAAVRPVDTTAPEGLQLSGVTRDAAGKEHATFKPKDDKNVEDAAKQLERLHKITPNELLNPVSVKRGKFEEGKDGKDGKFTNDYAEAASGPAVAIDVGSRVVKMSNSEYERFKKEFLPKKSTAVPSKTTAPTAANRFVFNPVTKKLEPAKE